MYATLNISAVTEQIWVYYIWNMFLQVRLVRSKGKVVCNVYTYFLTLQGANKQRWRVCHTKTCNCKNYKQLHYKNQFWQQFHRLAICLWHNDILWKSCSHAFLGSQHTHTHTHCKSCSRVWRMLSTLVTKGLQLQTFSIITRLFRPVNFASWWCWHM